MPSRQKKIFKALNWLVLHNSLQYDVVVDGSCLDHLPEDGSIEVKSIFSELEEEDFTLPDTDPSSNDQFEDYMEELSTSSLFLSSVKQPTNAKVLVFCGNSIFSWIGYWRWTFQWIWHYQFSNNGLSHNFFLMV